MNPNSLGEVLYAIKQRQEQQAKEKRNQPLTLRQEINQRNAAQMRRRPAAATALVKETMAGLAEEQDSRNYFKLLELSLRLKRA